MKEAPSTPTMPSPPNPFENLSAWPHLRPPIALTSHHGAVPAWLDRVHALLSVPDHSGALPWTDKDLAEALKQAEHRHAETFGSSPVRSRQAGDTPDDRFLLARPSTLMHRVLVCLQYAQGRGSAPLAGGTGWDEHTEALAFQLLAEASRARTQRGDRPEAAWHLPGSVKQLTMTLLIVSTTKMAGEVGEAVELVLSLVRHQGARAALVPAPEQVLTPVTEAWADGLRRASAWWNTALSPWQSALDDWAVVWSIVPRQKQCFGFLSGDSASATIALGGLWLLVHGAGLLRHLKADHPWKAPLQVLTPGHLSKLYLSAAMAHESAVEGELELVGKVGQKSRVLQLARQALPAGELLPLHTARIPAAEALAVQARPHASLLALVRELCLLDEPPTDEQLTLLHAVCAALLEAAPEQVVQPPSNPCPTHPPPRLDVQAQLLPAVLKALAHPDRAAFPEVRHPIHLALHRWAVHGGEQGGLRIGGAGQVHSRFVNLQLKAPGQANSGYNTLAQLLDDPRVRTLDALIVEGEPGAGKSWLMMRHEQALCEQLIAAHGHLLAEPGALPYAGLIDTMPVLPLFLALKELPADADDPVTWFRQALLQRFPQQQMGLDQVFQPTATRPYRVRVLIDGLNEVKVQVRPGEDPAFERSRRVNEVIMALKRALPADLPMVLGTRPGYAWTLQDERGPLRVELATVQRWSRPQIRAYIDQRWKQQPPEYRDDFMAQLPQPPEARPGEAAPENLLLGLPLFLNLQCELWEAGARRLTEKQSHLLASMLWLRLDQAYQLDAQAQEHVATPGMLCPLTELPRARTFRAELDSGRPPAVPPVFPRRGLLLRGLFALAKAQWLHHADQPTEVRGEVAVPLALVRQTLEPLIKPLLTKGFRGPARHAELERHTARWLAAVKALGLAQEHKSSGTLSFSHQRFGEWLASQQLFFSGATSRRRGDEQEPQPRHWPGDKLAQLLQELSPPPLERSALAELDEQRTHTARSWSQLPDALFTGWLEQGITLHERDCASDLEWARRSPFSGFEHRLDAYLKPPRQFLSTTPSPSGSTWTWHVQAFGDFLEGRDALPGRPPGSPWWHHRHLWAVVITRSDVLSTFRGRAREEMEAALGGTPQARRQAARLWEQQGRLRLPLPGPLDDIMPLALDGMGEPSLWWQWLNEVAAPTGTNVGPSPTLLHTRPAPWALLSACLTTLQPPLVLSNGREAPWADSARHLLQVALDARGHDLRQRLQAGLLLGRQGPLGSRQGDHLRYERVPAGVRLRRNDHVGRPQWLRCGGPDLRYRLARRGDAGPLAPEESLPVFEVAAYPVTVGEFQAFLAYPGALDSRSPWWQAAGQSARTWLQRQGGANWSPPALGAEDLNNPLQPITTVPAHAADAYVHWAQQVLYGDAPGFDDGLRLALPSEWQLEAAVRGPWSPGQPSTTAFWPGHEGDGLPQAMLFNHVETGWGRPSPVGCFAESTTPQGLADGAGNVWSWCVDTLEHQGQCLRALRGGSFNLPARRCAAGFRDSGAPGLDVDRIGFRLARVVSA